MTILCECQLYSQRTKRNEVFYYLAKIDIDYIHRKRNEVVRYLAKIDIDYIHRERNEVVRYLTKIDIEKRRVRKLIS